MFRPMRRFKQALTKDECERILVGGTHGVLSVITEEGYHYGVPMSYAYKDGKLFFSLRP